MSLDRARVRRRALVAPAGRPRPARAYVFVVGLPRSGTHLVRDVLNSSPLVKIGEESRFLGRAKRLGPWGGPSDGVAFDAHEVRSELGARRVVARIWEDAESKQRYTHYWQRLARHTDQATFLDDLLATPDRDARHVLELAMLMAGNGREVCGEKTPHHVFHLDRLFAWYPQALGIHVIRDPRAVYASARARAWTGAGRLGLATPAPITAIADFWSGLESGMRWREAMALDRRYAVSYPGRYIAVQFESLVLDPEPEIRRLCAFIGIPFEEAMMRPRVASSSFLPEGAPGFRTEVLDRWRTEVPGPVSAWIAFIAGSALADHGYAGSARSSGRWRFEPAPKVRENQRGTVPHEGSALSPGGETARGKGRGPRRRRQAKGSHGRPPEG